MTLQNKIIQAIAWLIVYKPQDVSKLLQSPAGTSKLQMKDMLFNKLAENNAAFNNQFVQLLMKYDLISAADVSNTSSFDPFSAIVSAVGSIFSSGTTQTANVATTDAIVQAQIDANKTASQARIVGFAIVGVITIFGTIAIIAAVKS